MRIRKFQATNMSAALAKLKAELGPDAMVVSTRHVRRGLLGQGVEVTAAVDTDLEPLLPARQVTQNEAAPPRQTGLADRDLERIMSPLRSELRSLRSLIRTAAETAGHDAIRAELSALRQALAGMRSSASGDTPPLLDLAARSELASPSQKRVLALVGPTGVGKTTTIAKLAGRAALMKGEHIALISLDTYRVGGEEQMRIFADLIGVPLHLASDRSRLHQIIRENAAADRIFIDTAGRSPRDIGALRELEDALRGVPDLETHLAISASTSPAAVDATCQRYQSLGIERLLFTKLDEAHDLAVLVRAPARAGVPVSWVTTGQRIPEDIEAVSNERLLELATSGFTSREVAA